VRTALACLLAVSLAVALLGVVATPWAAPTLLVRHHDALWLVSCAGLAVSVLYEAAAGLYRLEQLPQRYLLVTLLNVGVTVGASVLAVVALDAGALGLVAGSYLGTAVALVAVLVDRRHALRGPLDPALLRPMLRFGLPFVPSRLALWGLNFSNRILLRVLASQAAVGLFAPAVRLGQVVALLVTAFQLAWPPFAYSIQDDAEAGRVYRAVFTYWMVIATWVVLALALLREPIFAVVVAPAYRPAADAMAVYALGLAFYGAYYVAGVAVGRVKRTGLNWVVTGAAAVVNVGLCLVLIPWRGVMGAAIASTIAYGVMALVMALRGERLFPVGYEWPRVATLLAVAGVVFAAADSLLPESGAAAWLLRGAVAVAYPLALLVARFFRPEERRRLRALAAR
jgi:O-antigen/teichoic acid export membrane protein